MAQDVSSLVQRQRAYFHTGVTRDVNFRVAQLKTLKAALKKHEAPLMRAVKEDMGKPDIEAYSSELGATLVEINVALRHVRSWSRPRRVSLHIVQLPSIGHVVAEPLGVSLIIGPWNYPIMLLLAPLISAMAAGNCAVLKPSELAPCSSRATADMIADAFEPEYVAVVEGGPAAAQALLSERFDKILYTGSERVGRLVALAAAENLTPVTLELGGKSPAIVDETANIERSAKRIVWGKFWNAGQTCVAPDYVLVQRQRAPQLIEAMKAHLRAFYSDDPQKSEHLARIVNDAHFARLSQYLNEGTVVFGGQTDPATRFIAPTLIENAPLDGGLMTDEIFGPILPIVEFEALDDAFAFVNARPRPLAFYFFSESRANQDRAVKLVSFGGGCINDTIVHFTQSDMPFGGVGSSGHGAYHGEHGFDTFSNFKGVVRKAVFSGDDLVRFPPHTPLKIKLAKLFLR